jgi:hypothetical protein
VRRLLVLVVAALLAFPAAAGADVYDDNPAAASRGPGDMVVVARGNDGLMYERHLASGAWTPWASIGGPVVSGPAAAAFGDAVHVFALGSDNAVLQNVFRAGSWSGWVSLGGYGTSAPAAIARRGTGYLDLEVRGGDNTIYHRSFVPGSGWSPWSGLGGNLTSGPAANSQEAGVLNVWARGTDGQLYQRAWTGTAWWTEWMPLGGGLLGAPSVLSRMESQVDVFVRGTDRALHQRWWRGGTGWSAWERIDPTPLDSSPGAASDTEGHIVLFARRGGGIAVTEWRDTSGWTAWTDWGPVAPPPPPPPPPAPPPDGSVELVTGLRCTPPGGRLRVSLRIRKRPGMAKPRVRKVVFFVKRGPRRTDRRKPYVRRLRLHRPAGSTGRVFARAFYTRKGSRKLRRKTVSRRFVMCR